MTMIINGIPLVLRKPIIHMIGTKEVTHGVSYGLGEAGYDIRIKQSVTFHAGEGQPCVVVMDPLERDPLKRSKTHKNTRFTLASALEEFDMPPDLVAVVHDKSTWARRGLSVFNTVIEPGWKGFLTLELVYHGNGTLTIPAGAGIAQVLFSELKSIARYHGKYQNQGDFPSPAKEA